MRSRQCVRDEAARAARTRRRDRPRRSAPRRHRRGSSRLSRPPDCASPPPRRIASPRSSAIATSAQVSLRTSAVRRCDSSPSVGVGKGLEQHLGDDQAEHAVAEEFEALIAVRGGAGSPGADGSAPSSSRPGRRSCGRSGARARRARRRRPAHTTSLNSRFQRTVHGHFQNSQRASPVLDREEDDLGAADEVLEGHVADPPLAAARGCRSNCRGCRPS